MKYFIISLSILIVGCFANKQKFITPLMNEKHTFYSGFSKNSFYIYVSLKVDVLEFVKTFEDAFGTGEALSNHIRIEFERKFDLIFDEKHQTDIVDPLYQLELQYEDNFNEELHSTVSYNDIEYLIMVQNIRISNTYMHSPTMMVPSATGGMMMTGGGSLEDCIVEYRIKVIESKTWKMVNEFMVSGNSTVTFFNFETTLMDAISNSVSNAIEYLTTGVEPTSYNY